VDFGSSVRVMALGVTLCGVIVLLGVFGCGGLPDRDNGEAAGAVVVMVTEAETDAPLQVPATVIVGGVRGVLTPSDEHLVLRNVPIGSATPPSQPLTVSARGYVTHTQQVQMSVTAATWVQITVRRADPATTGTVEGTVVRADDGAGIRNAFLRFSRLDAAQDELDDGADDTVGGYTDSEGRFVIGGIPKGQRLLAATAAGFLPFEDLITIIADADGENAELDIQLISGDTTVNVSGIAVEVLTRLPIENVSVSIAELAPVVTGANGRFTIEEVPVGEQTLVATAEGFDDFSRTIEILPGMDRVTIEMFERADEPPAGPYTIGGSVTLGGAPDNAGATVSAVLIGTDEVLASTTTGPSGDYGLFLPPGRYQVTVRFEDRSLSREVTVPGGGVIVEDVDFVLAVR
jgi:hypothetical protein